MSTLWWIWLVLLPDVFNCYENLCISNKPYTKASQSSTRENLFLASRVIDGNRAQNYENCSHTKISQQPPAWVKVDLGRIYSLSHVVIYYRSEDDWKPKRFRKFYLEVSKAEDSPREKCYTDTTPDSKFPNAIQNITCKAEARYVIVETKYDAPDDDARGPILEVCEIEVYGCDIGHYGKGCIPCSNCDKCDVNSGACDVLCSRNCIGFQCDAMGFCTYECVRGYWGTMCTKQCPRTCANNNCSKTNGVCFTCMEHYYGTKCENRLCPNCRDGACGFQDGRCSNGCIDGYHGWNCAQSCSDNCNPKICQQYTGNCAFNCSVGYYGSKCESHCSTKCSSESCRKDYGECVSGCQDGYYGYQCRQQCSLHCKNRLCDKSNGHCVRGCDKNYYGNFCNLSCSSNCADGRCNQSNGFCNDECLPNWTGNMCNKCISTHFGNKCSVPCGNGCKESTCNGTGYCDKGCLLGYFGYYCNLNCSSSCRFGCDRTNGVCIGECVDGFFGSDCELSCNKNCKDICDKTNGACDHGCVDGKFGEACQYDCSPGCHISCERFNGNCTCKHGWQGYKCNECKPDFYGANCTTGCNRNCLFGHCHAENGTCVRGCKNGFLGDQCSQAIISSTSGATVSAIGVGLGTLVIVIIVIIIAILFIRFRRKSMESRTQVSYIGDTVNYSARAVNKLYIDIGNVLVPIEDPEEEPQIENPEEAVYYNDLSVAKDVSVSDLLTIITQKEARENEGFQKEFKSLPYGERFACETAKTEENMLRNRFKTTFPYDHSRVILEVSKEFASDYINANYIENMEGRREFIACQGPRENTVIDHWRMIWQEKVEYIVMLTNLIEGPKVKCHQYWPDEGKELDINPLSVTMVEEKVYAYFVERKMNVRKKRVTGSRTVTQYHYTRWPDHGTPNPLNLVVFHRHFRHKIRPTQHPIIVHCSAGIGRTGTFIALDVLCRYGKNKGKVNVIEYVKDMRRGRMTMIQNVDQYVFLYHALYEFFRRKGQYRKKDEFRGLYGDTNRINSQKQLTNEFNELVNVKPSYDARGFKSGKKYSELNFTKSVLPVEQYLVYLTSHVSGREPYYNAVHVSSFTGAEEFISAQFPVSGAAIDLARLLVDQESTFLISMNPLSEMKELQNLVEGKAGNVKLNPYTIVREEQTTLSDEIRKTNIKITKKGFNKKAHAVQIFECMNWNSTDALPAETSSLTNLIKQFSLDRKSHPNGHITVISKDGATCCGVFIAVYNAIEQLQQDDEVDISTIVQQIQCRRPEMVSTKEEYEFCYKAVSDFLNTDSVYANT